MTRRKFDCVMVHHDLANSLKLVDFTDAEVKAFVVGVLPIAGLAEMRGAFTVGQAPATAKHLARKANVSPNVAAATLRKLRAVGMLEADENGVEWVHDFHEYNPEPKSDDTAAERSARYRSKQRAKRDASQTVTRDARDEHDEVTPPEGEVELEHPHGDESDETSADVRSVFEAWVGSRAATGRQSTVKLDQKRRRLIRAALKSHGLVDVLAAVQGWQHSPHHRGENQARTVYNDLGLLLRDADHIERFRDLHLNASGGASVHQITETQEQRRARMLAEAAARNARFDVPPQIAEPA